MKILSILSILFLAAACERNPRFDAKDVKEVKIERPTGWIELEFQLFELDGCEYYLQTEHALMIVHKGNCKYCKGANKELEKAPKPATIP